MSTAYPITRKAKVTLSTGPTIAYQLYIPSPSPLKLALIAHPLGRLGGRKEDHVVQSLSALFVRVGYAICTYDARGAGKSSGSGSFTATPEAEDFQELIETILLPLLKPTESPPSSISPPSSTPPPRQIDLVLCGYSFGSLAASSLHISSLSPSSYPPATVLRPRYLLISYPLSVLWALTAFRTTPFVQSLSELVEQSHPVLAVYGTQDQFSGIDKLRAWSESLKKVRGVGEGGNRFQVIEVEDADHFWGDEEMKSNWLNKVKDWLEV